MVEEVVEAAVDLQTIPMVLHHPLAMGHHLVAVVTEEVAVVVTGVVVEVGVAALEDDL